MKKSLVKTTLTVATLLFASMANAGLIQYSNRTTFEAQGAIIENYGYEDFGTSFYLPDNPWTAHGITYQTGKNIIVGTGTFHAPISNVFTYNGWTPVTASISQSPDQFDMFGLDLGYLGTYSAITFTVNTNLASYVFSGITVPIASQNLNFFGFIADTGEHFTSFNLSSAGRTGGSAPVIDNVTLGQSGQVAEPATLALLGLGLAGLGFSRRRIKG